MMDIEAIRRGEIKDLWGAELPNADLENADLRDANLQAADLHGADLRNADLRGANLERVDLEGADLWYADLRGVILHVANLRRASLWRANLQDANLRGADLRETKLQEVDLQRANLRETDLRGADLRQANLSNAKLPSIIDWLVLNLEKTLAGWIVYKRIGKTTYATPNYWTIETGSVLIETCNSNRTLDCECGINFGTREWCNERYEDSQLWRCLIRWEWGPGICVPYNTDGKARCERLELLEQVG